MGLSQSTRNSEKSRLKNFNLKIKRSFTICKKSIKEKFNKCYINCCMPFFTLKRKDSEEIVNTDIELKEIKCEEPDVKLINCKLNKKTPSLNNYINDSYIRSKSDSSIKTTKKPIENQESLNQPI